MVSIELVSSETETFKPRDRDETETFERRDRDQYNQVSRYLETRPGLETSITGGGRTNKLFVCLMMREHK